MASGARAETLEAPIGWAGPDSGGKPVYHNVPPTVRLRELLALEKEDLWVAVVYSVVIGLLTLAMPVATQSLVNTVAFGNLLQPLVVLTFLVLVGLALSTVLQSLRIYVVEMIQRRVFVRIASTVTRRLLAAKPEIFDKYHGPELVNRFFDVVTLQKSGAMLLIDGLSVAMQTFIGMVLLALYHPWLLAFDILLLGVILFVLFPLGRGAATTAIQESKAKYALAAWLEEVARFPIAFKTASGTLYAAERADELVGGYLDRRSTHFRILMRQIAGSLGLQAFALAGLLGVGGWLVIERQLTLGQLIAAELVVALIVNGVSKLGKHLELFYDLVAAIDKLGYLTDLPVETTEGEDLPPTGRGAAVELRGLTYRYPGRGPLLESVDLAVSPGERVGIRADRGRGKSTLFALLSALRAPDSGVIRVDGMDLRELNKTALRSRVAFLDDTEVFDGSLLDNLRLGPGASSADARRSLEAVGLLDDVSALPEGLETHLSTGGAPLSPRQAKRLMFARALLAAPRLLLVDELLDGMGELREEGGLLDAVFSRETPWTLMVVSSNETVLSRCDRVYALENGTLRLSEGEGR